MPELTDGSVRIAVRAAGVNFADTLIIAGKYQNQGAAAVQPRFRDRRRSAGVWSRRVAGQAGRSSDGGDRVWRVRGNR